MAKEDDPTTQIVTGTLTGCHARKACRLHAARVDNQPGAGA
ncbi:MAG: hypothetical protein PHE09_09250 [Oscillospiraceae bacterium]|nr:hypothetical protein [Oscillospiraceae bacterium]